MAFNISYVYEIINKASGPLKKIAAQQRKVAQNATSSAKKATRFGSALKFIKQKAIKAAVKLRGLGRAITFIGSKARNVGRSLFNFAKRGIAALGVATVAIGGFALKASASLETLQISFESMLGSADKARAMVKKLVDFTARTPFQLEGVGQSAKQLLAFGVTSEKLLPTLKVLGDISAGANVQLTEMAAIFGKVKAKGKAYTEELLQLSDRGIPIIDILAKKFKVTKQAIFDAASKGKISFKIIENAMKQMTAKGGIFFNQMEKQSATLTGVWSTLKDNLTLGLATIGDKIVKELDLKESIKNVTAQAIPMAEAFGAGFVKVVNVFKSLFKDLKPIFSEFFTAIEPVLTAFGDVMDLVFGKGTSAMQVFAKTIRVVLSPLVAAMKLITRIANADLSSIAGITSIFSGLGDEIGQFIKGSAQPAKLEQVAKAVGQPSEIIAPGAQEIKGALEVKIDITGNREAVNRVTIKPVGKGNLGINMAGATI